jgi:hypothetical protein
MLAAGTPNQAFAGETRGRPRHGQKHVSHVLGELGPANRTEAVARARELGPDPLARRPSPNRCTFVQSSAAEDST